MQFSSSSKFIQRLQLGGALFIASLMLNGCTNTYSEAFNCSDPSCAAVALPLAIGAAAYEASEKRDRAPDGCSKLTGKKQQQCYAEAKALSESINNHRKQQ